MAYLAVFLSLILLLAAALIYYYHTREKVPRLLAIACAATGVYVLLGKNASPDGTSQPIVLLWLISLTLCCSSLLHVSLSFPRRNILLRRFSVITLAIVYLSIPVAGALAFYLSANLQTGAYAAMIAAWIELGLAVVIMLLGFSFISNPLGRARLRWWLLGAVLSLLLFAAGLIMQSVLAEIQGLGDIPAMAWLFLLIWLPFAIAVLLPVNRLMDFDSFTASGLTYVLLLTAGAGLDALLASVGNIIVPGISGNLVMQMAITLVCLAAILSLRPLVTNYIEQNFFRSKLHFRRLLPRIGARMATLIDQNQVAGLLVNDLPEQLQIDNASLLVLDQDEQSYVFWGSHLEAGLPLRHSLVTYLMQSSTLLVRSLDESKLAPDAAGFLMDHNVEISIPLIANRQLIGIYNLGPKAEKDLYTHEELRMLAALGQQAAISVNNARNTQEISSYSRALEDQVRERTTELARAVRESQESRFTAERANRAKNVFLGSVSHEIRTPMNAIIGMTELLIKTPLKPRQRDFIDTIRKSGESLLHTINDILDYSIIESGRLRLEKYPFNLSECIESALDLVGPDAARKKIELSYLVDAETPVTVLGDYSRLQQILLNLVSNAIKFTETGKVVVSVGRFAGSEPAQGSRPASSDQKPGEEKITLQFSVRDTGIGIARDQMDYIFQPFSQVDDATTRKYGGTGLGLTISQKLSEVMGGKMWVESEGIPGQGSVFHFTIKVETAEDAYPAYLGVDQPQLAGKRILIVDDNEENRKILTLQTESWGMTTIVEAEAAAALARIKNGEMFDIALLDMQMPEMDGMMLAQGIRQIEIARSMPLVLMTSMGFSDFDPRAREFAALLTKPIKAHLLYNALTYIFAGDAATRAYNAPQNEPQVKIDEHMGQYLPLNILIAEDNPTNKKLALLFLEALGYQADTVSNGLEVLEAMRQRDYDVVLMDIQMPLMDGLDATRQIRQLVSAEKQPSIIAMTANTMQGDRERCLEAGMNDYISKPVRIWELIAALNKAAKSKSNAEAASQTRPRPESTSEPEVPVLDTAVIDRLRTSFGERAGSVLPRLVEDYLQDAARLVNETRQALNERNVQGLRISAHTLKSNSAALGALALASAARELEELARGESLDGAEEMVANIEAEYERMRPELQTLSA